MDRHHVTRLARMDLEEIGQRGRALTRNTLHRVLATSRSPRWDRRSLARALAAEPALNPVRAALMRGDWLDAHRRLAGLLSAAPPQFVIGPALRPDVARAIRDGHPGSPAEAAARADRIVTGTYDLLGYRGLRFDGAGDAPDWHVDPVHDRRAPREFWTEVPYLDPACGDHKIIWELNRHQHWLTLGRADWLTGDSRYRRRFLAELTSWLEANPPLIGVNWASMLELGLRAISWVWALQLFLPDAAADESPWIVDLLLALDRQLTEVEHNLSRYFSPNTHLLGEALALYVSGRALPTFAASARREQLGRRLLLDEIDRQILPDGGHCERSTHYHRYTLDFYSLGLAVALATGDVRAARFEDAVVRLAGAARLLADNEGHLPGIGDDDGGLLLPVAGRAADDVRDSLAIAAALTNRPELRLGRSAGGPPHRRPPEEAYWMLGHPALRDRLERLADVDVPPPPASAALPDSGYYVSRAPGGVHVVIDGGAHGFRNAGHAHADALSMTLSVDGEPMLIDTGTGCYTVDPELRDRFRSTALHNTVVVDGRPQSLPAGPFAWSATTDGRVRHWRSVCGIDYFEGTHDGYRPIEHRRHVLVSSNGAGDRGGSRSRRSRHPYGGGALASGPAVGRVAGRSHRRADPGRPPVPARAGRRRGPTLPGGSRERPGVARPDLRPHRAGDHPPYNASARAALLDCQRLRPRRPEPGPVGGDRAGERRTRPPRARGRRSRGPPRLHRDGRHYPNRRRRAGRGLARGWRLQRRPRRARADDGGRRGADHDRRGRRGAGSVTMCGIAGFVESAAAVAPLRWDAARDLVHTMCVAVRHRGPDHEGALVEPGVALGMRRLSIVDVAAGHQPLHNEDRTVSVVFNGEIYNYRELRDTLQQSGHRFTTATDTEVIVHGYEQWGTAVLGRLRGMFAFAIWDRRSRTLLLGRDRVGIKPLHYAEAGGRLYFASEIKSILRAPGLARAVNLDALDHYLSFLYTPEDESIFMGIRKLPPGHLLIWRDGRVVIKPYFRLPATETFRGSERDAAEQLLAVVTDAVRSHLIGDVPIGALLSGGTDSSLVVGLMAGAAAGRLKTFSIGFDEASYNELAHARRVAEYFGTDHYEDLVRPDAVGLLDTVVAHFDEPFADASALPTWYVSRLAARHVKVVLSGDGGDELFGGYDRYLPHPRVAAFDRHGSPLLRRAAGFAAARMPRGVRGRNFLRHVSRDPRGRYLDAIGFFSADDRAALFLPDLAGRRQSDPDTRLGAHFDRYGALSWNSQMMRFDMETYLPEDILVKVDRMSTAHSLESRVPLLDNAMLDFAASLPADFKIRDGERKRVLKAVAARVLPPDVLTRRKQGFGVPIDAWFRGPLRDLAFDLLLAPTARQRGYFRPAFVERLLTEHASGRRDHALRLWQLVIFESWHRQYLDASGSCLPFSSPFIPLVRAQTAC